MSAKYVKLTPDSTYKRMETVLLITKDEVLGREIDEALRDSSYHLLVNEDGVISADVKAALVLIDSRNLDLLKKRPVPVIALIIGEAGLADKDLSELDDILFPPFDIRELSVRIRRLLLKSSIAEERKTIVVDKMVIDLDSYEVRIEGGRIELTFKEYELLKHLAANPGRVYDRQTLLNAIWDYDYFGGTRTVDVHIRRLRAKLGTKYGAMIQTVRQVGYRFSRDMSPGEY